MHVNGVYSTVQLSVTQVSLQVFLICCDEISVVNEFAVVLPSLSVVFPDLLLCIQSSDQVTNFTVVFQNLFLKLMKISIVFFRFAFKIFCLFLMCSFWSVSQLTQFAVVSDFVVAFSHLLAVSSAC